MIVVTEAVYKDVSWMIQHLSCTHLERATCHSSADSAALILSILPTETLLSLVIMGLKVIYVIRCITVREKCTQSIVQDVHNPDPTIKFRVSGMESG